MKICLSHYELYKAQPFHLTMTCKVVDMVGMVVATERVVATEGGVVEVVVAAVSASSHHQWWSSLSASREAPPSKPDEVSLK